MKHIGMACEGNGKCFTECECTYAKGTEDCSCLPYKHKHIKGKHHRFCIKGTQCRFHCQLKGCETFNYCQQLYPEWYYTEGLTTGKQCNGCGIYDVKFTNKYAYCDICFMDKYLIETDCKHEFCLDCLQEMNGYEDNITSPCPFCRKNIEHNELTILYSV